MLDHPCAIHVFRSFCPSTGPRLLDLDRGGSSTDMSSSKRKRAMAAPDLTKDCAQICQPETKLVTGTPYILPMKRETCVHMRVVES